MTRILIAGFQHETNTFGATRATLADFEMADSWPGLLRGSEVVTGTEGSNVPLAGFVRAARQVPDVELLPVIWCSAEPSAQVTDHAFETIAGDILQAVRTAGPLDGIYLDLHGAMVTDSHDDGEGELLARLRAQVGPDLPISISLDLHANLTQKMVDLASSITVFRTYPHLDMAETGARAFQALMFLIGGGQLCAAYRQSPFLIPLQAQYTGMAPCDRLYAGAEAIGPAPQRWAEFAAGFTAADVPDMGPSLLAYAARQADADAIVEALLADLLSAEPEFDATLLTPDEAVGQAMRIGETGDRPVIIADVQDNPGAGGTSDTGGMLSALVRAKAKGAVLGMLCDAEMAEMASAAGEGGEIAGTLGGKAGTEGHKGRFIVERLTNGHFAFTGQMYAGSIADTGPSAVLRVIDDSADIRVVVSSKRCQCLDQAIFTHAGIEPAQQKIVVVKSTVHFQADFRPIASAVLNAAAPGRFPCNLEEITFENLRQGVRKHPSNSPTGHR